MKAALPASSNTGPAIETATGSDSDSELASEGLTPCACAVAIGPIGAQAIAAAMATAPRKLFVDMRLLHHGARRAPVSG